MDKEIVELRIVVERLSAKVSLLEEILLTFRQANLIMVGKVEDSFGMERSKKPKRPGCKTIA